MRLLEPLTSQQSVQACTCKNVRQSEGSPTNSSPQQSVRANASSTRTLGLWFIGTRAWST